VIRPLAAALALASACMAASVHATGAGDERPPSTSSGGALPVLLAARGLHADDAAPARSNPRAATACELRLTDHRSGRELRRLPLDPLEPEIRIAFEHSVIGTTVIDRYRFTPAAVLIEEEFEGEGYGLPAAPGPGERLERVGSRQRLVLRREVHPLVVRPAAVARTRVLHPGGDLMLASLGAGSVAVDAVGCETRNP
jgi:hypothetical protein